MSFGWVGSPARRETRASSAARAFALEEVVLRVKARICASGAREGEFRRAWMTELPWVPVAPTTRYVRGGIFCTRIVRDWCSLGSDGILLERGRDYMGIALVAQRSLLHRVYYPLHPRGIRCWDSTNVPGVFRPSAMQDYDAPCWAARKSAKRCLVLYPCNNQSGYLH